MAYYKPDRIAEITVENGVKKAHNSVMNVMILGFLAGGLLVLIGFVPKIAAMTQLVPTSVLGGAMVALFGMVVSSGIRMLGDQVDLNRHENLFIIACSVGMGLGGQPTGHVDESGSEQLNVEDVGAVAFFFGREQVE